jgi:hypothetical protein
MGKKTQKKTIKPKKPQKNPLGWFKKKKTGFFPTLALGLLAVVAQSGRQLKQLEALNAVCPPIQEKLSFVVVKLDNNCSCEILFWGSS